MTSNHNFFITFLSINIYILHINNIPKSETIHNYNFWKLIVDGVEGEGDFIVFCAKRGAKSTH